MPQDVSLRDLIQSYLKSPASFTNNKVSGKVCQVSGIQVSAYTPSEFHINQQMIDDLVNINSTSELVCLALTKCFKDDQAWVMETMLEQFHKDQVRPEYLYHLIDLHYANPHT